MPQPRLDTGSARKTLQDFRFDDLFIEVLNWNNPPRRNLLTLVDEDNAQWQAREISELGGLRVYEVRPVDPSTSLPNAKSQQTLWKGLSAQSVENIAIFVDAARAQSLGYWMKRDDQRTLPRRHTYIKGQPGDLFLFKLAALVVDLSELNEQGDVPITNAAERVRSALDVETVTKVFFREFKEVHDEFLTQIEGIADENDRRWYASVLLNRLMFIWFLQKKFFLDGGDPDYLRGKYEGSAQAEPGKFFSHFLRDLFFEGFAKPAGTLRAEIDAYVAQLYNLTGAEFTHILSTFSLVKSEVKARTFDTFSALLPSADDAAVARLIVDGETDKVEFKEAAAYSRQVGRKQPEMLTKVLRETAAFLNTSGGSLLIGVDDAGVITGLTDDFPAANERKPNLDGYGLFLREAMSNRLDAVQTMSCAVTFHRVNNQDVCRVLVPASPKPVYLDGELLIRSRTTSRSLRPQDATSYVFQHWGTLN